MVPERTHFMLLAAALGLGGCDWVEEPPRQTAPVETIDPGAATKAVEPLPPPTWSEAMTAGIRPPAPGYATYDVDPFIAAVIVNAIRSHQIRVESMPGGQGFRLVSLPAGIPHAALGFENGDIIEAINDVPVDNVAKVIEALAGARNGLTLTIHRDDLSFTLRYRLTESLAWTDALLGLGADVRPAEATVGGERTANDAADVVSTPQRPPRARPATPSPSRPATSSDGVPSTPSKPSTSSPSKPPSSPASGSTSVRCASVTQCEIDRAHFQALMANPNRLESQARIVPAIRNDIHSGYKLKSIKPGSDLDKLGFRNEDKITHINGVDVTNEAAALALYGQANTIKVFNIRYERGGRATQKTVKVR